MILSCIPLQAASNQDSFPRFDCRVALNFPFETTSQSQLKFYQNIHKWAENLAACDPYFNTLLNAQGGAKEHLDDQRHFVKPTWKWVWLLRTEYGSAAKVFQDGKADISFLMGAVPKAVVSILCTILTSLSLTTDTVVAPMLWKTVANIHWTLKGVKLQRAHSSNSPCVKNFDFDIAP